MKDHSVTVTIQSESFGAVNQTITMTEYAMSPEELVYKHQNLSDQVVKALNGDNSSGGELRRMGDEFLDAMNAAGGDLEKAAKEVPWGKRKGKK